MVRIVCGAGFAGDRIDSAADLAERGRLDSLAFECLAERQRRRSAAKKTPPKRCKENPAEAGLFC